MHTRITIFMAIVGIVATVTPTTYGQSIWMAPQHGHSVSVEILKPHYTEFFDAEFLTSAWYFSAQYQVSPSIAIIAELPVSHMDGVFEIYPFVGPETISETIVGNPLVGIVRDDVNSAFVSEFSIRLPFLEKRAAFTNSNSDVDRWSAFITDALTLRARGGMKFRNFDNSFSGRVLFGLTTIIHTKFGDPDVVSDLVAQAWLKQSNYQFGVDFSNHVHITDQRLFFSERTEFALGLGVTGVFNQIRPGLRIEVPLGNDGFARRGGITNYVLGFNLAYIFPSDEPRR